MKNAVDRRPLEIGRVLRADDDIPELPWAGHRLGPIDRKREDVGGLIPAPMLAVQLADPVWRHQFDRQVPFGDTRCPQGSLGRGSQLPGNVRQIQWDRGQVFPWLSCSYSP